MGRLFVQALGRSSIHAAISVRLHRTAFGPIDTGRGKPPAAINPYTVERPRPTISRTCGNRRSRSSKVHHHPLIVAEVLISPVCASTTDASSTTEQKPQTARRGRFRLAVQLRQASSSSVGFGSNPRKRVSLFIGSNIGNRTPPMERLSPSLRSSQWAAIWRVTSPANLILFAVLSFMVVPVLPPVFPSGYHKQPLPLSIPLSRFNTRWGVNRDLLLGTLPIP